MVNADPWPTTLSAWMVPLIRSASSLHTAKPSPVPPYFLVVEASACTNLSNRTGICPGSRPIPVSLMTNSMLSFRHIALTPTSPEAVNLMALEITL